MHDHEANFLDIKLLAHNIDVDILCISESWLTPITPDGHIDIPDYQCTGVTKDAGLGHVCI